MTVQSTIAKIQYAGNGIATNFTFPNLFFIDANLVVTLTDDLTGIDTTQIIVTDYTVTGAGNPAGGDVIFIVAPPTGQTLTIARILEATQLIDYIVNDAFPAETHERGLDKLTMLIQQLLGLSTQSLSIQYPLTEPTGTNNILPNNITRRGKLVTFDSTGGVIVTDELGSFAGDYIPGTSYDERDLIRDPATGDVFIARNPFTATTIPADLAAGNMDLLFSAPASLIAPVGTLLWWPVASPPSGFLIRDGAAISRTTFSALFSVIGTNFGIGDGSTTYNLPDDLGRFIRGFDNGAGVDPDAASRTDRGDGTTGDAVGTLQADEFKSHKHTFADNRTSNLADTGAQDLTVAEHFAGGGTLNHDTSLTGGLETRPLNRGYLPIIKT